MAKIDSTGFTGKSQNEYFSEERDRYLAIDTAWSIDPSTPDGLKLATDSELWANLDEALAAAYNSKDPDRAMGIDLDALMQINGLQRLPGSGSTVTLTLSGTDGTVVPALTRAKSSVDGSLWATAADVTIAGGTAVVSATCTVPGPTQASVGDITLIADPIGGWQSVTNAVPASVGVSPETDALARIRRHASVSKPGQNQVDATFAEIANVIGVSHARVYENYTGIIDSNGLPPHSTNIIVDGGDSGEIAQAIYDKRNPGPEQHQSATPVNVTITSSVTGNQQIIKFDRPTYVDTIIVVDISNDGSLPGNAVDLVKAAIIKYSAGEIDGVVSAFNQSGYGIGDDVFVSQLYSPINSVIGAYGGSYVTSVTVNGGPSLTIAFNALSRWSNSGITVNIV